MLYDLTDFIKQRRARGSFLGKLTRRGLLKYGALAGLAGVAAPTMKSALIPAAEAAPNLSTAQSATLLRMARDIYPHETLLDDAPYQAVIDNVLSEAANDSKVADLLLEGLADLDRRATEVYGTAYIEVKDPNQREGLLRAIELTDFFQKVRVGLLFGLYDNKALYPKFGYDGSSWEKGGFINAGFEKIDWF